MKGIVFDIKEFALNDGPGIRTTVFLKGCPLRCQWCHNPEGLTPTPQDVISKTGRRLVGAEYDAESLAGILKKDADLLSDTNGGVTFSGGEPLMQAEFLAEVIGYLQDIHILLDTSGYADHSSFQEVVSNVQHVYFDLKLMDSKQHQRWTGKPNKLILQNLTALDDMGVPYTIRVPLIPSVTDTHENLIKIANFVAGLKNPTEINLLPYNYLAGGKYDSVGMRYITDFDPKLNCQDIPQDIFSGLSIPVRLLRNPGQLDFKQSKKFNR